MLFRRLSRASRVPYSGMMRQATGCRSTFGDQWLQITSARRFPGWTGSSAAQVAPTIATKNLLLSLPVEGNWPRCKLHETEWSGGTAVTISAIHRVSLATHDLAEAQKFFESYIGLGQAIKVANQTIAFGSGSRGLRIRKPPRLLNRTTSELHGSAGTRHVAFD